MTERPLHIGVDGRELLGEPTGVGRYLLETLRVWAEDRTMPHRVTVFLPTPAPDAVRALGPRIEIDAQPSSSGGTAWEQLQFPRLLERAGVDVLFAAGYTAPLRARCPIVLAVHDVSFFAHPEWFRPREGLRRRWLTKLAAKRARAIITLSEFSAEQIVSHLGVARDRIFLAPPGTPAPDEADSAKRGPLVLYVGSLFARRHIPELVRAFALTAQAVPDARLVLVGANRATPPIDPVALARAEGVGDRVDWRRYVSDDALQRLYRQARVFVFLSEYEGFGMTPFEAIAYGAPAVLLDTPVAREVYADAAALVRPDPTVIAPALTALLEDDGAHAELLSRGRARARAFSWATSAGVIRRALEAAAGR